MTWIILGILDGEFDAPDGKRFENTQVIARVSPEPNETPWQALARETMNGAGYISELLEYRSKGRWEMVRAYELTGACLEPDSAGEEVLESLVQEKMH